MRLATTESVRLRDICLKITDGSHNPPKSGEMSEFIMISSKNVQDDHITREDPRYLTKEEFCIETKRTQVSAGDVLFTIVGTVGRTAVVPEGFGPVCLQRSVAVVKPNPNRIDSRYLMYQFRSKRNYFESEARGVAQKGLYLRQLEATPVNIHALPVQREIAAVLDRICALKRNAEAQLAQLKLLAKSRFVEMFGDGKYADAQVLFKSICEFVTVGIANSATHAYSETGVVMLRNQNIKENRLDDTDLMHIKPGFAEKYKSKTLKENDILVTRTGYPGIACLVPKQYEGSQTFTTLIARLQDIRRTHPVFVSHYINSSYGKKFVEKNKVGVAQQNFGAKTLDEMPIVIPPYGVQEEFAAFIEQLDKSQFAVNKLIEQYDLLYRAKLQEYFG